MTTGITLSASVRNNLLSLQSTAKMMSETQNRLATGNKVNSAVDNATSFFTAAGLTNRASDLSGLQDDMGLAVKTVKAASTGIDGISKLLTQAKSIVNQANQVKGEATATTGETSTVGVDATPASDKVFTVNDKDVKITTTGDAAVDAQTIADGLNNAGIDGLKVTVDSGKLSFSLASGEDIKIEGAGAVAVGIDTTFTGGTTAKADQAVKVTAAHYDTQYNDLLDQIDQLAKDSSFNGVNLLDSGSLDVKFNAEGTSHLQLTGVDFSTGGSALSIAKTTGADLLDKTKATAQLDKATTTLRAQASAFGSNLAVIQNRQDFTQATIDNLGAGAGDLTLADTNQEGANLLALQTRQSLATTALSLSNQAQSSILSILR
jgi:flagellin-like hook-associated protein FlgL